jgi:putative DNA primase/helicase
MKLISSDQLNIIESVDHASPAGDNSRPPGHSDEDPRGAFGRTARDGETADAPETAPPEIFSPTVWLGKSPPAREWIVPSWIPCGVVTGLYGDGGLGKTLLAQQLQTSTATGKPWFGLPVDQVASLGVYCEDSRDELWRRQIDINSSYEIDHGDLADVRYMPRLGKNNILMTFSRNGVGELTRFHHHIVTAALDFKARLVVVDTAADTFGGNENDRNHVRQFISRGLGSIAQKINGAVLLCAHPSRSGLASGEGDGGSTGWSNAFRSRLYLCAPSSDAGDPPDPNARILQRRKANYAARSDEVRLRWRNGVIESDASMSAGATPFCQRDAKDVFLDLVAEFESTNRTVSEAKRAGNYAPRAFGRLPREQRHDYREAHFSKAMEALFASRKIENVDYGRKSDMRRKIILARKQ